MIAGIADIDARTMFKLKGWNIVRTGFTQSDEFPECYAMHTECKSQVVVSNTPYNLRRQHRCYRCGAPVPDEMQALVALSNWKT